MPKPTSKTDETLEFFLVRSQDGKWFRRKGYGGYGDSWVDDIKKARVYQKSGPARAVVSFWADQYPEYGVPVIVRFVANIAEVIDETARVGKAKKAKQARKDRAKVRAAEREIREAEKAKQEAEERLNRLKRNR